MREGKKKKKKGKIQQGFGDRLGLMTDKLKMVVPSRMKQGALSPTGRQRVKKEREQEIERE